MIKDSERNEIIEIIGARYSRDIEAYLISKGVFKKDGSPHSTSMIRNVMNGDRSHEAIEAAIFEFAAKKKAEKKALRNMLKTA